MAEEEQEKDEATGGSKKKLIFIILGAVLLIGGSVAATLMLLGGDEAENSASAEETEVVKGDPSYIELKPPFTVNLDPDDPVGFLQIAIQVLTYNDAVVEDIEKHKPLIRNNLVTLFGQQKSVDLRSPQGKESLQKMTLETVQAVVDQYGSGGEVDNVFFTNFVMQ